MKTLTQTTLQQKTAIPKELWVTLGGNPLQPADDFGVSDAYLTARIPESQTCLITKRVDWQSGTVFYPWSPGLDSKNYPYYCLNEGILYLCLGNNPNNNEAESGNYLTKNAPTHISALPVTYSDGYTWLSLWKLDYNKANFLTDTDLPVVSFEIVKPKNTYTNLYGSVCPTGITSFGTCCLYYKQNTTDTATGITHAKGDLYYGGANMYCYQCYELAQKLNFEYIFKQNIGATGLSGICDPSITIKTIKETLEVNESALPPNSTNQIQLQLLKEYTDHEEGVMRVSINLDGLDESETILNTENPYLIIADPNTTNPCQVQLKTAKLSDTEYKVIGIELIESGSNHILPSYTIQNNTTSTLINHITLITYPKNIFTDPALLLPINSYAANAFINVGDIKNISYNDKFTKIALATNLKTRSDDSVIEYAPETNIIKNLQTRFLAIVTSTNEAEEEIDETAVESLLPPQEAWIDCGTVVNIEDCAQATNRSQEQYSFYVSALKTGNNLVEGENYGLIVNPDTNEYVPGFKGEINDSYKASPVRVNDKITLLGNNCRVFKVIEPELSKDTEFISKGNIDLNIANLNSNINLAFSFKVNT